MSDTRECLLLLEAILETPGLMARLTEVLRNQGSGVRDQGSEIKGQRTEIRDQKTAKRRSRKVGARR